MKTMRIRTKTLMGANRKACQRRKPRFEDGNVPLFPEATDRGLIQWPTEEQILDVSKQLAEISRVGIRAEASGEYFNSGELAYELQEIIRATAELFKRGQRVRR